MHQLVVRLVGAAAAAVSDLEVKRPPLRLPLGRAGGTGGGARGGDGHQGFVVGDGAGLGGGVRGKLLAQVLVGVRGELLAQVLVVVRASDVEQRFPQQLGLGVAKDALHSV